MSGVDRIAPGPRPDDLEPEDAIDASGDAPVDEDGGDVTGPAPVPVGRGADMAAAKATAARLGTFLQERLEAAGVLSMPNDKTTLDEVRPYFEKAFGPALRETKDEQGRPIIGDRFIMKSGNVSGGSQIELLDGHPLMRVMGLAPMSSAFFYVATLVDLQTGDVYQEKSRNGGGSGPLTIFGPLVPPEDARLKGNFSWTQLQDLGRVVTHPAPR